MMYYANKIVGWLLGPMGLLFGGLAVSWLLCKRGFHRTGCCVCILVLGLIWGLGCGITTRLIGVPLEGPEVLKFDPQRSAGCDAVVLLGGGMGAHPKCGRAEMFGAADRVWQAARVWKALNDGSLRLFVTSKDVNVSTMPLLRDLGVDEGAIVYFPEARNTEDEAEQIANSGVKRILLVTSAWHMPRAKMLLERKGLEVVPVPCDYEMSYAAEFPIEIRDFFPSPEALSRNSVALKEWVARFGYKWLR